MVYNNIKYEAGKLTSIRPNLNNLAIKSPVTTLVKEFSNIISFYIHIVS